MNEEELLILNPTAERYGETVAALAPRLRAMEGKTIGLLWNGKAMGDVALQQVAASLSERSAVDFLFYTGSIQCPSELLDQVASECDAVIGCTADCGSCTSWMVHDCISLERRGLPSVVIVSAGFEHDAEASARAFAMPGAPYVVVPKVYNNLSAEMAIAQTLPIVSSIESALTARSSDGAKPEDRGDAGAARPSHFTYTGSGFESTWTAFNDDFMRRDWGDGYPLIAPTPARVDELLASCQSAKPDEVVCYLPPGNGEVTIERAAVNAAMAGCRPQEFPVVVAGLRAIANTQPSPRGPLMSTSATAPFFVVNGPIAKSAGINGGRACLGPGRQNEVNIRIGRAIVLALKNLGTWYPGVMDLDSIGTTRKHISVIAENEDESPWEPYHVSQGFGSTDSTITLFWTSGELDVAIQGHIDSQQLAKAIGSYSGGNNASGYLHNLSNSADSSGLGRLLLLPPPHAIPLAEGGFTKSGLEKFMFHHGGEPVARMIEPIRKLYRDGKVKPEWQWLFELSPQEAAQRTIPVIESAERYKVVVAGSVRAKDLLMPTRWMERTELVTEL